MGLTGRPVPETLSVGSGEPVTVLAHGLGGSLAETRPLGSGLAGTQVLYAQRGHTTSPSGPEPVTYALLGDDLLAVADACGATRALGVSMGAGALLSLLARAPARFGRAVLFLPGALDRPREDAAATRLAALADALDAADAAAVLALVAAEVPADLGAPGAAYVRARSAFLLERPGVAAVLRSLPAATPVPDRAVLGEVKTPVLVLAQEGDPLHPAQVAREIAAALPAAELVVFDRPGVLFRERRRLRALLAGFLDGTGAGPG